MALFWYISTYYDWFGSRKGRSKKEIILEAIMASIIATAIKILVGRWI